MSHNALAMRLNYKIISIKEEGDSSLVNQAYDKEVARSDKCVQCHNIAYLRQLKGLNNFIDQWSLVLVGSVAVRFTRENPHIWINFFKAVNLHRCCMLPFKEWCKKIEHHMHAFDSFKLVT